MEKNMSLEEQLVRQKFALVLLSAYIEGNNDYGSEDLNDEFKFALGFARKAVNALELNEIEDLMEERIIFYNGVFFKAEII